MFTEREALLLRLDQLNRLEKSQLDAIETEKAYLMSRLAVEEVQEVCEPLEREVNDFVEGFLQSHTSAVPSAIIKESLMEHFGECWSQGFPAFMKSVMRQNYRIVRPYRGHYYYHRDD